MLQRSPSPAGEAKPVATRHLAARIIGAGAYVPTPQVSSSAIASALPGWPADKIVARTGIEQRRWLWPLDIESCRGVRPVQGPASGTDMAEIALKRALAMGDVAPEELDLLFVVTCTPDQPRFSHDALELQRRLNMRADAHCLVVDSGCGGSLYMLDMVARTLHFGAARTAAIVGTNLTSPLVDGDLYRRKGIEGADGESIDPYLSGYVFGDGAGAVVVRRDQGAPAIAASLAGNGHWELVRAPGGGAESPSYGARYNPIDHAFIVNGRLVMETYLRVMRQCIEEVARAAEHPLMDVERFYLHQANLRALHRLTESLALREAQVAENVSWLGNTSSAGMFILLAEDLASGRIPLGRNTPIVLAAIGAGVHYGAQLIYV